MRTDFGHLDAKSRHHQRQHRGRDNDRGGTAGEDNDRRGAAASAGSRERLFLLVELTCTVQTSTADCDDVWEEGGGMGGGGAVHGPLKNFRAGSRHRRNTRKRTDSDADSEEGDDDDDDDDDCDNSREEVCVG